MASKMNPGFMAMMAKKKDSAKDGGMHKMPDGKMMKNSAHKMASGGMPMVMKDGKKMPAFAADGEGKMKHGGTVKKMASGGMTGALAKHADMPASKAHNGMKHGGAVKSTDGIAQRGKTRA
jgi:hypothetical protein